MFKIPRKFIFSNKFDATKDYYKVLGVKKSSGRADIKKSYYKLVKKHHPDQGGDAKKFKQISEAYHVLEDA